MAHGLDWVEFFESSATAPTKVIEAAIAWLERMGIPKEQVTAPAVQRPKSNRAIDKDVQMAWESTLQFHERLRRLGFPIPS